MITVIDLHISNIKSVCSALSKLGVSFVVSSEVADVQKAEKIILPGVGSFVEGATRLESLGVKAAIREQVLNNNVPILGICLGMQLLLSYGHEGGGASGLDLVEGEVVYHRAKGHSLRLPHIGWNDVHFSDFTLFNDIEEGACFYFVHSYEAIVKNVDVCAYSEYGEQFCAAFQKGSIYGVQFHPEKSQKVGLQLLENFTKEPAHVTT